MAQLKQKELRQQTPIQEQKTEKLTEDRKSQLAEETLRTRLASMETSGLHSRRRYDWEWLTRDLFVRGFHFAKYNRSTHTFTFSTKSSVRIPINLIHSQLRNIRSSVTAFRPKWEILPETPDPESIANAELSGRLLDALYQKLKLRNKVKSLVHYGLVYSLGIWQVVWDEEADKGQGEIRVETVDPFDLIIDPNATDRYNAEYMISVLRKPITEIKNNKRYKNTDKIHSKSTKAVSEYKQFLLQALKNLDEWTAPEESETTLLREAWIKQRDENGNVKMRVITYTDEAIHRDEVVDEDDFPWFIYKPETSPGEIYSEGWAKHVIPLNRVIDALESHIFEYNHLYAKGRFVIDKNSGVRTFTNEHGQVIEKNRGAEVTSLPITPLPEAPFQQLNNFKGYQEDVSSVHEVSMGRVPAGVKSGVGIAELKQADAAGQDEIVDNLEEFLTDVGTKMLEIASKHYTSSKIIRSIGPDKKYEYFAAVGKNSSLKNKPDMAVGGVKIPVAKIGADNEIRVTIGSWLAYTKQARQEELKELFKLGAIDQRTLLEHLEFGDIKSVLKATRLERLLEAQTGVPAQGGMGANVSDEELAIEENAMFAEGKSPPAQPEDNHDVHLIIHDQAIGQGEKDQLVEEHMEQHRVFKESQLQGGLGGVIPGGDGSAVPASPQGSQQAPPGAQTPGPPPGPPGMGGGQIPGV
jgi:hypothetical protein